MSTAVLPISIQQFLDRPPRTDGLREELIQGEIVLSPNVKRGHSEIQRRISVLLRPLEQTGYVVLAEFACSFIDQTSESLPNPDLGVVLAEEWNAVDDDAWLERAPALMVEVASPSNRKLHVKAALYLEHGAEQVWSVFPKTRTVGSSHCGWYARSAHGRDRRVPRSLHRGFRYLLLTKYCDSELR